jgi:putative PIG3 family NAD(P)H quinone oxidoreductase
MLNGVFNLSPRSRDLALQRGDARVQLGQRQRVQILCYQNGQQVVGTPGRIVELHDRNVDPGRREVNNVGADGGLSMTDVPDTMLAIDPERPGGPEVLVVVERPVPRPGPGEVLIRVAAAGVNRPDLLQRQGGYPPPPGAPTILGLEVAGVVVAAGDGADAALIGQEVCALVAGGGYAHYVAVPAGQCLPVPAGLALLDAAATPETLFTVWTNLFERAYATEGDTVLVHGGTSGIGTMAIALCQLFGITVIVTAGSDAKCEAARALGATHAINYNTEDFVERVREVTVGRGVQAVLDMVGGDYVPRNIQCLADDGRHVSIAVQRGATASIPIFEIMRRRLTLTGSTLRPRDAGWKSLVADELSRTVWPHVASGRIRPVIDRVFPLHRAADAHRRMEAGEHVGKIVLAVA